MIGDVAGVVEVLTGGYVGQKYDTKRSKQGAEHIARAGASTK